MQEQFIFFPEKLNRDHSYELSANDEEIFIPTFDGESINGLLFKADNAKGVILYFHGNAGSLASWQYVAIDLVPLGYDVLIIDFRGYGKSTGEISEKGLYIDATAS